MRLPTSFKHTCRILQQLLFISLSNPLNTGLTNATLSLSLRVSSSRTRPAHKDEHQRAARDGTKHLTNRNGK